MELLKQVDDQTLKDSASRSAAIDYTPGMRSRALLRRTAVTAPREINAKNLRLPVTISVRVAQRHDRHADSAVSPAAVEASSDNPSDHISAVFREVDNERDR